MRSRSWRPGPSTWWRKTTRADAHPLASSAGGWGPLNACSYDLPAPPALYPSTFQAPSHIAAVPTLAGPRSLLDYAAMKTFVIRALGILAFLAALGAAQDVIPLYPGTAPGSTQENYPENEYFSKIWSTEVVANVTKPSLTVFKPSPDLRNGTAVVVCPGGGFMALSITSEGNDVAKYLAARGVTAFVLKYRLAHTGVDATQEFNALFADRQKFQKTVGKVVPLAVADGLAAVTYVRQHASDWGVSPDRVGIIGFSAGGAVTAGGAFHYLPEG